MTHAEYRRIVRFLEEHAAEARQVMSQDKSIPDWGVTRFCQFRDVERRQCFIYSVRPVICRLFGMTEWLPCPLGIVPPRGEDAMTVFQGYANNELRTFEDWNQRSETRMQKDAASGTGAD